MKVATDIAFQASGFPKAEIHSPLQGKGMIKSITFDPPLPPGSEIGDINPGGHDSVMASGRTFLADILPDLEDLGTLEPGTVLVVRPRLPSVVGVPSKASYKGKLCLEIEEGGERPRRLFLPLGVPSMRAGEVREIYLSASRSEFFEANPPCRFALGVARLPQHGQIWGHPTSFFGFEVSGGRMILPNAMKVDVADALYLYQPGTGPVREEGPAGFLAVLENLGAESEKSLLTYPL